MTIEPTDLTRLAAALVHLLRERAVEAARDRVRAARDRQRASVFVEQAALVSELNRTLARLRAERDQIRQALETLPPRERTFARIELEPLLDELFNAEIASLRSRKRRAATPAAAC